MVEVDVLVPVFNDPEGLTSSLNTIKAQSWRGDFRVCICDDGSAPENTKKIREIADFFGDDFKVVYSRNKKNSGRPYTRNVLLDMIDSDYVSWLDAGDEWYPKKIENQFASLYHERLRQGGNKVWVSCNYDWQWIGKKPRIRFQSTGGDQLKKLLIGSQLRAYLWTLMGTASSFRSVGYFDESLPRLQDLDFFIRFILAGGKIVNVEQKAAQCVYMKSDIGRDALQIRNCFHYINNKYSFEYAKYGNRFKKNRLYEIELHAARFAKNNDDHLLLIKMLASAAKVRSSRFITELVKGNLGL